MFQYIILGVMIAILIYIFSHFRPTKTQRITENLYAVRCMNVNFYVYDTGNKVVVFDTGINPQIAISGLKKLGLSADQVTHIFLTHSDFDHVGGINAFPKAEVYLSENEVPLISGKIRRRGLLYNRKIKNFQSLKNEETVTVDGTKVQIFVVPGHTPGSAVYLIDERFLITGDLLSISRKGKVSPFFWLMNMEHKQDMQSIKDMELVITAAEYIMTGHTGILRRK